MTDPDVPKQKVQAGFFAMFFIKLYKSLLGKYNQGLLNL